MSSINVQLFEELFDGRKFEPKRAFATALTEANGAAPDCGAASADSIFQDVRCDDWASAGQRWAD
jgi:4-oxalocrotonate tautomerase